MDALARQKRLIERLARSLQPGSGSVEHYETHISWVLVAGGYAFKFKKALKLPFLDFSTLAARRHYCQEECRLNRSLAPALYIDAVPVTGDPASPVLGGTGMPIEYAVWMRAFDQDALWSVRLARGLLDGTQVDRLAAMLAQFHQGAARAPAASPWGAAEAVTASFAATFAALDAQVGGEEGAGAHLAALRQWEAQRRPGLAALAAARKAGGMVRECHGDLHCGNILTDHGEVQAFDCIEFDEALRWIDVIDDLAFAHMDLAFRRRPDLAARLLNTYLEKTGDYPGLALLPYYRVHRALVRARVMLLRARQHAMPAAGRRACRGEARSYLGFARECARGAPGAVIAMHGFSGSGKTTVGRLLVELLGAVQLRSDAERKRLHGAAPREILYGDAATQRTYERLGELARTVAAAGWPVVVDAACLTMAQRERLRAVAAELGVPFLIVDVQAKHASMLARIAARRQAGLDASDADARVLERQLRSTQPLSRQERMHTVVVDTDAGLDPERLRRACAAALAEPGEPGPAGGPVTDAFQTTHIDPAHTTRHDRP